MSIFGLACSKAGGTPLQGDRGGADSLRVHKIIKIEHSVFYINYISSLKYNKLCRDVGIGRQEGDTMYIVESLLEWKRSRK